ncbi:MAG: riboflavin synthase [Deltaproteobacteria bacterium]|jgi:riboflavin synthase|nr:riboflavin synthase [Deltaproteobacteria bacterium]
MFTGIIEALGTIREIRSTGQGKRLGVDADFDLDQTKIGDSISVNGACLTVVMIEGTRFQVDMSPETLARTTFGRAKIGDRVNLERALRLSDRLDGHLVSGHIDGIGTVKLKEKTGNAIIITIEIPESLSYYMIKKGSVAMDGISLTINNCGRNRFDVSIIPHTAKLTTLSFIKAGDLVNIETDMIGKYIERFARRSHDIDSPKETGKSVDMQFLAKTGFI